MNFDIFSQKPSNFKKHIFSLFVFFIAIYLFYGSFLSQWISLTFLLWLFSYYFISIKKYLVNLSNPKVLVFFYPFLIIILTVAIYHNLLLGRMPWIADHLVHETNAFLLYTKLLPHFNITGWLNFAGNGYPANTLYPPGAVFFIAIIKFLSMGILSWESVYSLSLFLVILFYILTFYYLGYKHISPLAGFLTALFALVDHGAFRQGGWEFMIRWGVWPISLSLSFVLLSIDGLNDYFSNKIKFPVKSFFLGALAIITHPFAILLLFPIGFILSMVFYIKGENPKNLFFKFFLFSILIFLLSSWWLVPFLFYGRHFSAHVSALAGNLHNIALGLVFPSPWAYSWSWVGIPAILGYIRLFLTFESEFLLSLSLSSFIYLILGSSSVLAGLKLYEIFPFIIHIQFPRFLIFIKASAFFSASYFLIKLKFPLIKLKRPLVFKWILLPLLALLIIPLVQQIIEKKFLPLSDFPISENNGKTLTILAQTLKKHKTKYHPNNFVRVAIDSSFNDHRLASFPVYSNIPFIKLSYIPGETYIFRSHKTPYNVPRSIKELKLLNVAYVISQGPSKLPSLKVIKQLRGIYLYEFTSYSPEHIFPSKVTKLQDFSNRHIQVKISTKKPVEVKINISPFSRWQAYFNGKQIELQQWKPTEKLTFMKVKLYKSGILEIKYINKLPDILGILFSVLGVIILFVGVFFNKIKTYLPVSLKSYLKFIIPTLISKFKKHIFIFKYIKYFIFSLIIIIFGLFFINKNYNHNQNTFQLHNAQVFVIGKNKNFKKCKWSFPERFICGRAWKYIGLESTSVNGEIKTGFLTNPQKNSHIIILFPTIKLNNLLIVNYGLADSSGIHFQKTSPVYFEIRIGNKTVKKLNANIIGKWREIIINTSDIKNKTKGISFIIYAPQTKRKHFIFNPYIK